MGIKELKERLQQRAQQYVSRGQNILNYLGKMDAFPPTEFKDRPQAYDLLLLNNERLGIRPSVVYESCQRGRITGVLNRDQIGNEGRSEKKAIKLKEA